MKEHVNPGFNSRTSIIKSIRIEGNEATFLATPKFFDVVRLDQFGAGNLSKPEGGLMEATIPKDNLPEALSCIIDTASNNRRSGISPAFVLHVAEAEKIDLDVPGFGPTMY